MIRAQRAGGCKRLRISNLIGCLRLRFSQRRGASSVLCVNKVQLNNYFQLSLLTNATGVGKGNTFIWFYIIYNYCLGLVVLSQMLYIPEN